MTTKVICIAWFKPENYLPLKAMFEDGGKLHDTFEEWQKSANTLVKEAKKRGLRAIRVDIDPVEFPRWCVSKGLKLDANARSRYASAIGSRQKT